MSHQPTVVRVRTATLEIACEVSGPERGTPVILLHGFPDDPRTWDRVAAHLSRAGYRTIAPYLRGYGPTRFLDEHTLRSGQQAALGHDLLALMDGLGIQRAVLAGYDWGGRAGLAANRREFCKLLWRLWSPNWRFDDATYERTAASFDNPDFVDVVIHSYRHRFGWAPGDPSLEPSEERLAARPRIGVPTVVLHGGSDGVAPADSSAGHARFFSGPYVRRVIPEAGHFLAWEAPDAIVEAVRELVPEPN